MVATNIQHISRSPRCVKKRKTLETDPMPAVDGLPSPVTLSRYEDEAEEVTVHKRKCRKSSHRRPTSEDIEMEDTLVTAAAAAAGPLSPRVRKRLDEAKENASVFGPVCEQGEVVQWMSACHSGLISFGCDLERRGFLTLSSIAFLTEDDIDPSIEPAIRQLLLSTLARLRHEFFRM